MNTTHLEPVGQAGRHLVPLLRWVEGSVAVLCLTLLGCGAAQPPVAETPPPPVTVSQPVVEKITNYDQFEGRMAAVDVVELRARVRGHLQKVNFEDGQMVKEGELLVEIDPRPYQASLGAAKAQLAAADASLMLADREFIRATNLAKKGAGSKQDADVWEGKRAVAAADKLKAEEAVKHAQYDLDFTQLKAPLTGRISRKLVDVGNLVNSGGGETLLATIVKVDPMYVYFPVDERSLLRYRREFRKDRKAGAVEPPIKELKIPVDVALDGEQGYPHKGVIDYTDNRVNSSTGTIQVRAVLDNPQRLFDDGMRARVRVPVSDPYKAVLVTERAIGTEQGRKFVYVVDAEDRATRRDVTLGRVIDGMQVIQEGLTADDWVVVNGIQRVRDGMKVQPRREPMPGAAKLAEAKPSEPRN